MVHYMRSSRLHEDVRRLPRSAEPIDRAHSFLSSFQLKDLEVLPTKITPEVGIGLGAGTLADCIITGSLVYYLRKHKSGFNKYVTPTTATPNTNASPTLLLVGMFE